MMNKLVYGIVGLLTVAVVYLLVLNFAKEKKVVYINTPKLLAEYKGMQVAQNELKEKTKVWSANVDTLQAELEASIKKYEAEQGKMSKKERELSEELLRNKQQQFMQYQDAMRQKASEEDQKLRDELVKEVNAYIKEYGKIKGYAYIMGATNLGNLVYADEALDITEEVLVGLNDRYKKK